MPKTVERLAEEYGLDPEELDRIYFRALMAHHGMIDHPLNEPGDTLDKVPPLVGELLALFGGGLGDDSNSLRVVRREAERRAAPKGGDEDAVEEELDEAFDWYFDLMDGLRILAAHAKVAHQKPGRPRGRMPLDAALQMLADYWRGIGRDVGYSRKRGGFGAFAEDIVALIDPSIGMGSIKRAIERVRATKDFHKNTAKSR